MRILRICALHVRNRVWSAETRKDIDVTVSIITDDGAMIKPKDALKTECSAVKSVLYIKDGEEILLTAGENIIK